MFCKNCGVQLEDGALFCPECGTKQNTLQDVIEVDPSEIKEVPNVDEQEEAKAPEESETPVQQEETGIVNSLVSTDKIKYCHNCGAANAEHDEFCYNCGATFGGETQAPGAKPKEGGSRFKKQYAFIAAGVVVAALAIVAAIKFLPVSGKSEALVYIKDNEANVFLKKQPHVIGDSVYDDRDDADTLSDYTYSYFQISDDGKYLFYPQDYDGYDEFTLYRKKINSEKAEEVKIDGSVSGYIALSNDEIVYLKSGDDSKLYYSDLKDKRKIASDVDWFDISSNKKYVIWYTCDGENKLYVQDIAGKKDRIKIDADIDYVYAYSENFDKIVYEKEDYLYIMKDFEEKEKIASDVTDVNVKDINGDFGIYYTVDEDDTVDISLDDILDDEYAESDAKMKEPDITDYQKTEVKNSFWGPMESVTTDDKYYDDYAKYEEKLQRDAVRESLESDLSLESTNEYYYSDKTGESEVLLEGLIDGYDWSGDMILCAYFDPESVEKLSMKSLMNADYQEWEEKFQKLFLSGMKLCLFDGTRQVELDMDLEEYSYEIYGCRVDRNANKFYFLTQEADGDETYLMATDYSKGDGKLEQVAEGVESIELINDNGIYYIGDADEDGYEGTLYLNGKRIDDDVAVNSVRALQDNIILYMTDRDSDDSTGTINIADKTEKTRIADDVALYRTNDKNEIALLVDYNFKKYRGDLKLYRNEKIIPVDTDVATIVGFY